MNKNPLIHFLVRGSFSAVLVGVFGPNLETQTQTKIFDFLHPVSDLSEC